MFMIRKFIGQQSEEEEEADDDDAQFEYLEPCHTDIIGNPYFLSPQPPIQRADIVSDPLFQGQPLSIRRALGIGSQYIQSRDIPFGLDEVSGIGPQNIQSLTRNITFGLDEEAEEAHFDETKTEALVFQGGGAKGIAYCGAVKALERRGILKNIKRFGGTSAGAICAAFLAMEFSPEELEKLLSTDFHKLLMGDQWYDKTSVTKVIGRLWEVFSKFGVFSTSSFHEWLGQEFEKKIKEKIKGTEKTLPKIKNMKDITFKQVYDLFGKKELCIVVTDVCTQTEEYYHPKTTPNFPVREAVRMSMSIPFLFHPKILRSPVCDEDEYFIDGGVKCNFPLHCFDGWWLSMAEEDSFVERMKNMKNIDPKYLLRLRSERFSTKDSQTSGTLGLCVVMGNIKFQGMQSEQKIEKKDDTEAEGIKTYTGPPQTKLMRKKSKKNGLLNSGKKEYSTIDDLLKALHEGTAVDGCINISRGKICNILTKKAPKLEIIMRQRMAVSKKKSHGMESDDENKDKSTGFFAWIKEMTWDRFWNSKKDTKVHENDIISVTFEDIESAFLEITKRPFAEWITNIPRTSINDIKEYAYGVKEMLTIETRTTSNYTKVHDKSRTITIDTVYVDTTDFDLEMEDKKYLMFKGWKATNDFLNDQKEKLNEKKKA